MENKDSYIQVGDYFLLKDISKAKSCIGYLSISKKPENKNTIFFIKKVPLKDKPVLLEHQAESQLFIADFLVHRNILKCIDRSLCSTNNQYFVYEYCELWNLSEFFQQFKMKFYSFPTQRIIQKILRGIVSAICKMHSQNVMHREIKLKYVKFKYKNLETILSEKDKGLWEGDFKDVLKKCFGQDLEGFLKNYPFKFKEKITISEFEDFFCDNIEVKIIDLGRAKMVDSDEDGRDYLNQTFIITDMSPPEMQLKSKYGFSSDIWPIGAIALYLLTGKCKGIDPEKEEFQISNKFKSSLELVDFINCLLQKDPKNRLNYKNILNHPFLKNECKTFTEREFEKRIVINSQNKHFETNESNSPVWEDLEIKDEKGKDLNEVFIENPKIENVDFNDDFLGYSEYVDNRTEDCPKENFDIINKEEVGNDKSLFNHGDEKENIINPEEGTLKNQLSERDSDRDRLIIKEDYLEQLYGRKIVKIGEIKYVDEIEIK